MTLDSGVLTVWRGTNQSPPGGMPDMGYKQIFGSYYRETTVGIQRYYTAQQYGDRPDMVVRITRTWEIRTATDRVVLQPFGWQDNGSYRITQIQQVTNEDGLPATDLTLERDEGLDAGTITGSTGSSD